MTDGEEVEGVLGDGGKMLDDEEKTLDGGERMEESGERMGDNEDERKQQMVGIWGRGCWIVKRGCWMMKERYWMVEEGCQMERGHQRVEEGWWMVKMKGRWQMVGRGWRMMEDGGWRGEWEYGGSTGWSGVKMLLVKVKVDSRIGNKGTGVWKEVLAESNQSTDCKW